MKPAHQPQRRRALLVLTRDPRLLALNAGMVLAAPRLLAKKWKRYKRNWRFYHIEPARWTVSFTASPQEPWVQPGDGPHVVFVSQGMSEAFMAQLVAEALREERPDLKITIAVANRYSLQKAGKIADVSEVPLVPFDALLPVARWLERLQPDVVVCIERFWSPNLLWGARLWGAGVAVLAARPQPFESLRFFQRKFWNWQMRAVHQVGVNSQEYLTRMGAVLPPGVEARCTGSLKFLKHPPALSAERKAVLHAWLRRGANGRPLLVAGSTRIGEEEFLLDALEKVRRDDECVLVLAPRHSQRIDEVEALVRARGLRLSRRSQAERDGDDVTEADAVDVLLLDTVGELVWAYGAGWGAFVGGNLRENGHNVTEPLLWGIPVAYGPRRGHFETEQLLCEEAGVGIRVHTPADLAAHWRTVLRSPEQRAQWRQHAEKLRDEQADALNRNVRVVLDALDVARHR